MTAEQRHGALEVLTILDLSDSAAGAFAAKLFAGYGAQVIKVERPASGSTARPNPLFNHLNTNKLSLTLDFEMPAGAAVLSRLLEDADGLIEDRPTRRRAALGLDDESLLERVPRLVIAGVSAFGETGPYARRAFADLGPDAELKTGLHAFAAMLAALWNAAQTEHGQVVEVCGFEALVSAVGAAPAHGPRYRSQGEPVTASGLAETPEHFASSELPLFRMRRTPWRSGKAPALGEHTDYVLGDLIGLDAAEIEILRREGVV